jgi:hypothetical protein
LVEKFAAGSKVKVRAKGADGKVKDRDVKLIKEAYGTTDEIGPEELARVCQQQPDYLLIGTGPKGEADLTAEGKKWLRS